jgi:hypothetical protein
MGAHGHFRARLLAPLLGAAACGFGSAGGGSGAQLGQEGDDGGTGGTATEVATDGTADGTAATSGATGAGSVTDPGTGSPGVDATDSGDESGGSTGGPIDPCNPAPQEIYDFPMSSAIVNGPVTGGTHNVWGEYLFSETAGQGSMSFLFSSQCPGDFFAWAVAYDDDALDALSSSSADVFRIKIDNGSGNSWSYGCQSQFGVPWKWRAAQDNGAVCIDNSERMHWTLAPGPHTIHFENIEGGQSTGTGNDPGNVAALAHVIVTNDPAFSP